MSAREPQARRAEPCRAARFTGMLTLLAVAIAIVAAARARLGNTTGFEGDEAAHAVWGAAVYLDFAARDLAAILRHLYAQSYYPPLYSLCQVPFLAAMGITPLAHRLAGLPWAALACVGVYLCVRWSSPPRWGWVGASLAAWMMAGFPMLWFTSVQVYMEPLALAAMTFSWAFFQRALVMGRRRDAWWAGVLHLVAWYSKWQFGIFLSTIWVVMFAFSRLRRGRAAGMWQLAVPTLLPAWGVLAIWMANPRKLRDFLMYMTSGPNQFDLRRFFTWGMMEQARNLLERFSGTAVVGVLCVVALVWGLCRLREPRMRVFALSAGLALVLNAWFAIGDRGGPRGAMWLYPPLGILLGLAVNETLEALARRPTQTASLTALGTPTWVVTVLLVAGLANFALGAVKTGDGIRRFEYFRTWDALDLIVAHVPPNAYLCTVGCWDRDIGPNLLKWGYMARFGPRGLRYDDLHLWEYPPPDPDREKTLRIRAPWRIRVPGPAGVAPDPALRLRRARIDTVVTCLRPGEEYNDEQRAVVKAAVEELGMRPESELVDRQLGYRLVILRRPGATVVGGLRKTRSEGGRNTPRWREGSPIRDCTGLVRGEHPNEACTVAAACAGRVGRAVADAR